MIEKSVLEACANPDSDSYLCTASYEELAQELLSLRTLAEDMATGIEDYPQWFVNTEIALSSYRAEYPKKEEE